MYVCISKTLSVLLQTLTLLWSRTLSNTRSSNSTQLEHTRGAKRCRAHAQSSVIVLVTPQPASHLVAPPQEDFKELEPDRDHEQDKAKLNKLVQKLEHEINEWVHDCHEYDNLFKVNMYGDKYRRGHMIAQNPVLNDHYQQYFENFCYPNDKWGNENKGNPGEVFMATQLEMEALMRLMTRKELDKIAKELHDDSIHHDLDWAIPTDRETMFQLSIENIISEMEEKQNDEQTVCVCCWTGNAEEAEAAAQGEASWSWKTRRDGQVSEADFTEMIKEVNKELGRKPGGWVESIKGSSVQVEIRGFGVHLSCVQREAVCIYMLSCMYGL